MARVFAATINGIISAYNRVARAVGRTQISTTVSIDAGQLSHVSFQMGDLQGRMREIAAEQNELIAQLGQGYDEFVRARMQELLGVQEQVQQAITRQAQTAAN